MFNSLSHALLKRIARHYNNHVKISYINNLSYDGLVAELDKYLTYNNGLIKLKSDPSYKVHIDDLGPKKKAPKPKVKKVEVKAPLIKEKKAKKEKKEKKAPEPASKEEVKKEVIQELLTNKSLMDELQQSGMSMDNIVEIISDEVDNSESQELTKDEIDELKKQLEISRKKQSEPINEDEMKEQVKEIYSLYKSIQRQKDDKLKKELIDELNDDAEEVGLKSYNLENWDSVFEKYLGVKPPKKEEVKSKVKKEKKSKK